MTLFVNVWLVVGVLAGLFAFIVFLEEFDLFEAAFFCGLPSFFGIFGILGLSGFFEFLGFSGFPGYPPALGDVFVGFVAGGVVIACCGWLRLVIGVVGRVVKVGQRRGAQVPAHLRTLAHLAAPRSLRWARDLLPGDEGTAWLAEVASCLAEARDKRERRRYVRSYRRGVLRLIWTSWVLHLSSSRSRELS
ncbi:MAG: hypothetical protein ACRDS9_14325 [Pseudonocardiaceae bacterium]